MVTILQAGILVFVAVAGGAVVFTRDPLKQVIVLTFYGMLMSLMFFILQAPDVALSEIVVGAVLVPLMVLLALASIRKQREKR